MKTLFLLALLIPLYSGQDPVAGEGNPITVTGFKWYKARQPIENDNWARTTPAPAIIAANKSFERQRRINASAGERDPNADTIDGRAAALDKIVQESRESPPVPGFVYEAKIQNATTKETTTIFWDYQFKETASPSNVGHRLFVCTVRIKPEKDKTLQVFSLSGPHNVVNVKSLDKKSGDQFIEAVLINRVEYSDGSFWQRKGWDFESVRLTYKVPTAKEAKTLPMCRSL